MRERARRAVILNQKGGAHLLARYPFFPTTEWYVEDGLPALFRCFRFHLEKTGRTALQWTFLRRNDRVALRIARLPIVLRIKIVIIIRQICYGKALLCYCRLLLSLCACFVHFFKFKLQRLAFSPIAIVCVCTCVCECVRACM